MGGTRGGTRERRAMGCEIKRRNKKTTRKITYKTNFLFHSVNVYQKDDLTSSYSINAFPSLALFDNGKLFSTFPSRINEKNNFQIFDWIKTTKLPNQEL